jgi:hypothetical protein
LTHINGAILPHKIINNFGVILKQKNIVFLDNCKNWPTNLYQTTTWHHNLVKFGRFMNINRIKLWGTVRIYSMMSHQTSNTLILKLIIDIKLCKFLKNMHTTIHAASINNINMELSAKILMVSIRKSWRSFSLLMDHF